MKVTPGRQPGRDLRDGRRFCGPYGNLHVYRRKRSSHKSFHSCLLKCRQAAGSKSRLCHCLHVTQSASAQPANRTKRNCAELYGPLPKPEELRGERHLEQNLVTKKQRRPFRILVAQIGRKKLYWRREQLKTICFMNCASSRAALVGCIHNSI